MKKKLLLGSAILSLSALLSIGALVKVSQKEAVKTEAAAPYTVYIVSGNDNWLSWNNRFVLGDDYTNGYWSDPTASPIDSDFARYSNTSNFNQAKIGNTEYKFQKVTISNLHANNWITVQKYDSTGSNWEANGYNGNDQDFADGANSIINGTNNVLYIQEYSGRPWLSDIWHISGWYYKVICKEADGTVIQAASLQQNGYTPADPTAPSGKTFAGWYTNSTLTSAWNGNLTADTTLYAKYSDLPALSTPSLTNSNNTITWAAVSNAQSYDVTVDGGAVQHYTTSQRSVAPSPVPGTHTVTVKAIGDHTNYNDSLTASIQYTVSSSYYLAGSYNSWSTSDFNTLVRLEQVGSSSTYSGQITTTASNVEVKAVELDGSTASNWKGVEALSMSAVQKMQNNVSVTDNADKNLVLGVAGTYNISVDTNTSEYTVSVQGFVEDRYTLVVGSTEHEMVYHTGNEYKVLGVSLTHGQTIGLKKNNTVTAITSKNAYNNNIDESGKVVFTNASADVYVDVKALTVWSGSGAAAGFYMLKNSTTINLTPNGEHYGYNEYYSELISFAANDEIKFIHVFGEDDKVSDPANQRPETFYVGTIETGGESSHFEADGTNQVIRATSATDAAVYLKLSGSGDKIWFGSVSEATRIAKEYAIDWLDAINAICFSDEGMTPIATLRTEWQNQKSIFTAISNADAKQRLKDATLDDIVQDIQDFINQYKYILEKYGNSLGESPDFLNKGWSQASLNNNVLANIINPSNTIAIIVVISLVAVTSIGGYLFIRGRKHD